MIHLDSPPAFGFETSNCNSDGSVHCQVFKQGLREKHKLSVDNYNQHREKKGLDLHEPDWQQKERDWDRAVINAREIDNYIKKAGYFPLIGTLFGLLRLCYAVTTDKKILPNKINHIIRGSIEALSLGFLLIIPDLLLTSYRTNLAKISSAA